VTRIKKRKKRFYVYAFHRYVVMPTTLAC